MLTAKEKISLYGQVLQGLCSAESVSQRSPKSIAIKAVQIVDALDDVIVNGIPEKTEKK